MISENYIVDIFIIGSTFIIGYNGNQFHNKIFLSIINIDV